MIFLFIYIHKLIVIRHFVFKQFFDWLNDWYIVLSYIAVSLSWHAFKIFFVELGEWKIMFMQLSTFQVMCKYRYEKIFWMAYDKEDWHYDCSSENTFYSPRLSFFFVDKNTSYLNKRSSLLYWFAFALCKILFERKRVYYVILMYAENLSRQCLRNRGKYSMKMECFYGYSYQKHLIMDAMLTRDFKNEYHGNTKFFSYLM